MPCSLTRTRQVSPIDAVMQKYFLSLDAHFCEIDDGAVFLDIPPHKYLGTESRYLAALESWMWLEKVKGVCKGRAAEKAENVWTHPGGTPEEVFALARTFLRLRPLFYTAKNACLFDSLTMTDFILQFGLSPTFVIGVTTKPFGAHAWVQFEDSVLNDSLDNVQPHTPVFSI